jgi:thiol-disulfide isomerase/thioredoxin
MTKPALPVTSGKKVFWTPVRLAATFAVLALMAAFLLPGCGQSTDIAKPSTTVTTNAPVASGNQPAQAPPASARPLDPAILNTELKDLQGKSFKLSDYAGKVVVINLWATWCGPCRVEIPELIKLSNDYKAQGVELIGLTNEDPVGDADLVKDFVANQKITYRVGWGNRDFSLGLMQGNVREVIPQSFVITGDGRVIKHLTGFNPSTTPQNLRQAVEQALSFKG